VVILTATFGVTCGGAAWPWEDLALGIARKIAKHPTGGDGSSHLQIAGAVSSNDGVAILKVG
jgi:hypothetical protein